MYEKAMVHKDHQDFARYKSNQELAHFSRKLKCGLRKYKGNFPFKCLDYGRVGHFSSKYPYKETTEKDYDHKFKIKAQRHQKERLSKKKGL